MIKLSKSVFDHNTILKTVYLWQENFSINISEDEYNFLLDILPKKDTCIFEKSRFFEMLNEQQLRENLISDFGPLRKAIYQKAFSIVK